MASTTLTPTRTPGARRWRVSPVIVILNALLLVGLVVAIYRFAFGIGAISGLNDSYPWGFWISFDLLCGVALGAGAFTMAAAVYIFKLERFRPLLRPSILTGFLGYVMVIIALLVDLGRPERIWHMIVYQNGHSVLFEIGMCVMLYTTVLALEFAPVLLEKPKWQKPIRILHTITMPLVILGVVLSTLHQSSLGSLYLIMPQKVHPLWWSPLLPLFFFNSAVAVGMAMIIFESQLSCRAFGHGIELELLSKVAKAIPYALGIYLALKFTELAVTGELGLLFTSGWYSVLYWAELIVGVIGPIALFTRRAVRESPKGLLIGAALVIVGLMFNRFNVSLFALEHQGGAVYVPSWMEFAVSFGIISGGVLLFTLVAWRFPLFASGEHEHTSH